MAPMEGRKASCRSRARSRSCPARRLGIVIVDTIVRTDGTAEILSVVKAPEAFGDSFAEAAAEALRQWRFNPGQVAGEPANIRLHIEMRVRPLEEPSTRMHWTGPNSAAVPAQSRTLAEPVARVEAGYSRLLQEQTAPAQESPEQAEETEPSQESEEENGPVFPLGVDVRPPTIRERVEPEYPEEARRTRQQGTVVIETIVRRDGTTEVIRVLNGLSPELDEAAIGARRQWRFNPGTRNGEAVDVRLSIEINFTLR
jgi:TonB family protein